MAASDEIIAIALKVKPDEATLVPEKRQELTTEGGLDVVANEATVRPAIERLKRPASTSRCSSTRTSLRSAPPTGSGPTRSSSKPRVTPKPWGGRSPAELKKLDAATAEAKRLGLHVHMGHGLNYWNVQPVVRIAGSRSLNIGHSIVSRAVLVGMERAVREMKQVLQKHYPNPRRLNA